MAYNFSEIKNSADMVSLIGRHVQLKRDGPHYKGCCPFHGEDTPSFAVTPGKKLWKCFGCGKGGDIIDFFVEAGASYSEAISIVAGDSPPMIGIGSRPQPKQEEEKPEWVQATPDRWPENINHPRYGKPIRVWEYRDGNGTIISYDCRFEYEDDKGLHKDVLPLTFCTNGTKAEWRWKGMDKPRRLYGLDRLVIEPNKPVMVVEGRKTAEAAEHIVTNPIVATWQGGGKAVRYTDWSPLFGRNVTIWPDNDYEGVEAAKEIYAILKPHCPIVKFVHNPKSAAKGWDAYDAEAEGWTKDSAKRYLNQNLFNEPQKIEKPEKPLVEEKAPINIQQPPVADNTSVTASSEGTKEKTPKRIGGDASSGIAKDNQGAHANPYFRFLGFQNNEGKLTHCFYNYTTKTIVKLSVAGMGKGAPLLELAPLNYWEQQFPKSGGFDVPATLNWLVGISQSIGIFRTDCIRGRGAWMEDDVPVIHTGDRLIVDGKTIDIAKHHSKFIYEQGAALGLDVIDPLDHEDARKLITICASLRWNRKVDAFLFAGWCVVAPICGALRWRPHIWITGPAGSGKTWVFNQIVRPALGDVALHVQGNTSEAGVRQSLKRDARPVMFDEAEAEDIKSQDRMQSVLGLMRSASAEDGGNIIKGTTSSGADIYQVRSCFAYASIAMQISQQSDRSRITVLNLNGHGDTDKDKADAEYHFSQLLRLYHKTTDNGYFDKLRARTLKLLPIILKNAKTFATAAASVLGVQRTGDQLGALIAGAYSLLSDELVDYDAAIEWLRSPDKDWSQETSLSETRDERRLFNRLMETKLIVEGEHLKFERAIGELIAVIAGPEKPDERITKYMASETLRRSGIRVEMSDKCILFANQSHAIAQMLRGTNWRDDFGGILARIPGSGKRTSTSFGGFKSRATTVPLSYLMD